MLAKVKLKRIGGISL